MSFYCKKCGLVSERIKQERIVVKIRKIRYLFRNIYISAKLDMDKGIPIYTNSEPKVVKETNGFEIVEQDIYCPQCAPKDIKPEVVETVNKHIDRTVYVRNKEKRGIFSRRRR